MQPGRRGTATVAAGVLFEAERTISSQAQAGCSDADGAGRCWTSPPGAGMTCGRRRRSVLCKGNPSGQAKQSPKVVITIVGETHRKFASVLLGCKLSAVARSGQWVEETVYYRTHCVVCPVRGACLRLGQ